MGAAAGSAGTVWAQRKVKARLDEVRSTPLGARVAETTNAVAQRTRGRIDAALLDGRAAQRQRELDLRERFALPDSVSATGASPSGELSAPAGAPRWRGGEPSRRTRDGR